jgi:hypothetical protein
MFDLTPFKRVALGLALLFGAMCFAVVVGFIEWLRS